METFIKVSLIVCVAAVVIVALTSLLAWVTWLSWNFVVPSISGGRLPEITFWQAMALNVLLSVLFGAIRGSKSN